MTLEAQTRPDEAEGSCPGKARGHKAHESQRVSDGSSGPVGELLVGWKGLRSAGVMRPANFRSELRRPLQSNRRNYEKMSSTQQRKGFRAELPPLSFLAQNRMDNALKAHI